MACQPILIPVRSICMDLIDQSKNPSNREYLIITCLATLAHICSTFVTTITFTFVNLCGCSKNTPLRDSPWVTVVVGGFKKYLPEGFALGNRFCWVFKNYPSTAAPNRTRWRRGKGEEEEEEKEEYEEEDEEKEEEEETEQE